MGQNIITMPIPFIVGAIVKAAMSKKLGHVAAKKAIAKHSTKVRHKHKRKPRGRNEEEE